MHKTGSPEGWISTADALRQAREARGLSLDELAACTRISHHHLDAIEHAEFDRCGAPIYAVGFARSVARTLGVPEQPVVDAIKAGIAQLAPVPVAKPTPRSFGFTLGLSAVAALGLTVASSMIPGLRP
ncbi:helix-turn-helix domain-containing protein [Sphingomonas sp. JC676]|uniref:helix-turn-helix domain-containing protein n=1 Tax=Sphingomonas sp. JC676 TaxID=2768065 RepID=UPI001657F60E|nr:helix-turn-helix transcriptional regulator [Sphingomonas sp. JC676]MBC9033680.1 helix-turn-helix domain-containing protein [Sphingomonas sp. JC676]